MTALILELNTSLEGSAPPLNANEKNSKYKEYFSLFTSHICILCYSKKSSPVRVRRCLQVFHSALVRCSFVALRHPALLRFVLVVAGDGNAAWDFKNKLKGA